MRNVARMAITALLAVSSGWAQMMMHDTDQSDSSNGKMQTLMDSKTQAGYFIGPVVKFGEVKGKLSTSMGARAALLLDHHISIGLAGYGMMGRTVLAQVSPDTTRYLHLGYGGAEIGYIFQPQKLLNFSANLLIGGGSVMWQDQNRYGYSMHNNSTWGSSFFAVEPSVGVGLNITSHLRLIVGASYLITNGLSETWISDKDVTGFEGSVGLLFGRF